MRTWLTEHTIFIISHGNRCKFILIFTRPTPYLTSLVSLIAANHLFLSATNLPSHQVFNRDHTLFLIDLMRQQIMSNEAELPNTCQSLAHCQKLLFFSARAQKLTEQFQSQFDPWSPTSWSPQPTQPSPHLSAFSRCDSSSDPQMDSTFFCCPMQINKRFKAWRNSLSS